MPHQRLLESDVVAVVDRLRAGLGDRVSTVSSVLAQHGADESYHRPAPPDAVVYPESVEEVSAIVRVCSARGVPIVPFGTGTSLEGHIAAVRGGICVDMTRMNRILRVSSDDLDCTVEAGVTKSQLNDHLRDKGLFFPVDPGSDASLGGMAATRASGTTTVRYGTMREAVLGLRVVLSDGRIVSTGSRARKSAAGYDLTHLFVGSEGTLGILCELTLRLYGVPEAIVSAACAFETLAGAVRSVIETIQLGIPVARIELLDEVQVDAVNRYSSLDRPVAPTLFYEFHGGEASVQEAARSAAAIADANGGSTFEWARRQEDRNRLWRARHDAYYAALALRPGARGFVTDVCVPISELAGCIEATRAELSTSPLIAPILGHVGDGNFHVVLLVDPERADELEEAKRLNDGIVRRALAAGGTCTGEHGVGYGKLAYMRDEHGDAVDVMRAVKRAIDPQGILNPGKVVPA